MVKFLIVKCIIVKNVLPSNILLTKVHTYMAICRVVFILQVHNNMYHGIVPVPTSVSLNENNNKILINYNLLYNNQTLYEYMNTFSTRYFSLAADLIDMNYNKTRRIKLISGNPSPL